MIRLRNSGQPIFFLMIFLALFISVPLQPALAALIETETAISTDRAKDTRVLLKQLIAREDMRKTLLSYGINPAEADARVGSMTDSEICLIKDQMDNLMPGGDGMLGGNIAPFSAGVGIAIIIGVALLVAVLIFLLVKFAPESSGTTKEVKPFAPSGGNIKQEHPVQ